MTAYRMLFLMREEAEMLGKTQATPPPMAAALYASPSSTHLLPLRSSSLAYPALYRHTVAILFAPYCAD
jgi:hypothetical protein